MINIAALLKEFLLEVSRRRLDYGKYSNIVRTQIEIISDPNYLVHILLSSLKDNFQGT